MAGNPDRDDVAVSIAELQNLLLDWRGIEEFLQELVARAARLVNDGLACGITMRRNGRPLTVACSEPLASQVDEVQYVLGDGPCLHAMRAGTEVRIEDMAGDQRWAEFAERATAHGVRSSLSLPLTAKGMTIGAFNLYAPAPGAFGASQTRRAEAFAENASGALALAVRQAHQAAVTDQLRATLASRTVIDQALGVIMAQEKCSHTRAFAILRTASQNRNVKLRDISSAIVTSVSGEPPQLTAFEDE